MSNHFPEVPEGLGNLIPAQGSGEGSLVYGDREVETSFVV